MSASKRHFVAVIGGAVAGSVAAELLADHGIRVAVIEQNTRPYGKIEDGLPRWHVEQRKQEYARIDARIEAMFAAGFSDEVRALLEKGYSSQLPTLSAIGYREMVACLRGELTLEEAVSQMKRITRKFVRHQANWFKSTDSRITWLEVGPNTVEEIEGFIRDFLTRTA